MKMLQDIETVNIFSTYEYTGLGPRCNIEWWPTYVYQEYDPFNWMELNELLIHSLRSTKNGYPTYIMDLLKELYLELYKEKPTKGFIRRLMEGGKPIQWWQWDIFEEIQWRVSCGNSPHSVVREIKRRLCLRLDYEDVAPSGWGKRKSMEEAWRKLRMEAIEVYGGNCAACGRNQKDHGVVIHVDHINPKARAPSFALHFSNLQLLCEECNLGKGKDFTTDWRPVACSVEREDLIDRFTPEHKPKTLEDIIDDCWK